MAARLSGAGWAFQPVCLSVKGPEFVEVLKCWSEIA